MTKLSHFTQAQHLWVLIVSLLLTQPLFANQQWIDAQGLGVTPAKALLQAKRDALAKGIGQVLSSQTEVENFMVKRDHILTKTMGYIKDFKKLSENKTSDGLWEVKIQAKVSDQGLRADVAAMLMLIKDIGNPRIAILIQETNMGDKDPDKRKTVETALTQFLKDKEFDLVDPNQVLRASQSNDLALILAGDPEAAARLGSAVNAEVIIVGSAEATESDMSNHQAFKNSAMKSASAQVTLKAINVSNRRILAAADKQSAQIHPNSMTAGDRAFKKAVKSLLSSKGQFFDRLLEEWRESANDGQILTIELKGVNKFSQIKPARFYFQSITQETTQRKFSKPRLLLDVKYIGDIESLCSELDGKTIEGLGTLSVESYAAQSIQVNVK